MMTIVLITLTFCIVLSICNVYLGIEIKKEKRRNRILQSFVAGIIKSISSYVSRTDDVASESIININNRMFPIPYTEILNNIDHEFSKDFWIEPYAEWIMNDRNLFYDDKYSNDGFNMMYWDFHDKALAAQKEAEQRTS